MDRQNKAQASMFFLGDGSDMAAVVFQATEDEAEGVNLVFV